MHRPANPPPAILDTPPEEAFDRLTALATHYLRVPVSLISILDDHRQFFKSQCGLPEPFASTRETPLTHSFCKHVVADAAPLVVNDAHEHPLVSSNPAVTDLGVMAYLGLPLFHESGEAYGALCAIDTKPRNWSQSDIEFLNLIAAQVMSEITLRRLIRQNTGTTAEGETIKAPRLFSSKVDRNDFRMPMSALHLSLEAICQKGILTAQQLDFVHLAQRNVKSLEMMMDQMLDIGPAPSQAVDPVV